ncbi:MAG: hypothetical protein KA314_13480 [Chloroflexi bacterium]|nr:hypothetical protein [Chloroflexota bacterium]
MTWIAVTLLEDERKALTLFAQQHKRHPRQQAALLIRQGLETAGYLQADAAALEAESLEQEIGNAATTPQGGSHDQV